MKWLFVFPLIVLTFFSAVSQDVNVMIKEGDRLEATLYTERFSNLAIDRVRVCRQIAFTTCPVMSFVRCRKTRAGFQGGFGIESGSRLRCPATWSSNLWQAPD